MATCPICKASARPRADNPAFPFCSPRCKTIDLGKWMSEEYRVPAEGDGDTDGDNEGAHEGGEAEKSGPPSDEPVRH